MILFFKRLPLFLLFVAWFIVLYFVTLIISLLRYKSNEANDILYESFFVYFKIVAVYNIPHHKEDVKLAFFYSNPFNYLIGRKYVWLKYYDRDTDDITFQRVYKNYGIVGKVNNWLDKENPVLHVIINERIMLHDFVYSDNKEVFGKVFHYYRDPLIKTYVKIYWHPEDYITITSHQNIYLVDWFLKAIPLQDAEIVYAHEKIGSKSTKFIKKQTLQ